MKKILILSIISIFFFTNCDNGSSGKEIEKIANIEVYYFHGKHRCPTCIAIEEIAVATLDKYFSEELKNKTIVFIAVDMSKDESADLIEKFEVTSSSLFIRGNKDDKERIENLTEFGFMNALSNPEKLEEKIKTIVQSML